MHDIPPELEQVLRAQGLDDAELDELRRNGRIERLDDEGNSAIVHVGGTEPSADPNINVVRLDGAPSSGQIPEAALAKLRRFHRFMPAETIDQLERATGQDIDGDGRIGRGLGTAAGAGQPETIAVSGTGATPDVPVKMVEGATGARIPTGEHRQSGAMAGLQDGPFVSKRSSGSALPLLIGLIVIAALVAWMLLR